MDCLLHGVAVEGVDAGPRRRAAGPHSPKISSVLFFGVAVNAKSASVREQPARLYQAVDVILGGLLLGLFTGCSQRGRDGRRGAPTLAGVGLVDEDGETAARAAQLPISSRMKGNF